ncbi:MAG: NADH-quinone oxidoreductase subunit G [Propionibacteriaceae bacterium]
MTVTTKDTSVEQAVDQITLTIDGIEVSVPKGTLVIRAAERLGIAIPRFCDHPLLDPVGACRQCLVEVPDMGNGRGMPKPQPSCTLEAMPGMKISTQLSSPVAAKAQAGMLEMLLINHPLDCPICDKGGECPLQNQTMTNGYGESRYGGVKRTFPKPVPISAQILLDRDRCIMCARCTRFSEQISGDPFIALVERGALQQVGMYAEHPYDSYFSGNVIQICPVGALTSADYRFQSRPFDLVSTTTACEHCAAGCELRTDHRHYQVKRRLAGNAPDVNEEWNCDLGRFAFVSGRLTDRLTMPLIREDGILRPASWPEAIDAAVAGLTAAGSQVGVLTGGRLTVEAAYAYQRFARSVLGTNNVDFRARVASAEEEQFLAATVAGGSVEKSVTYADLERAGKVVLVGFEPEEESPIVFLRLRKAVRKHKLAVVAVASLLSNGSKKLSATLVPTAPGSEAAALADLADVDAGTVVLLGERLADVPGALSAAAALADRTGARLAWIPRRAGEVGAITAGCLPTLLPGGRLVADGVARVDTGTAWGVESLPSEPGLDVNGMLVAASDETLKALVVAGAEIGDFSDPVDARDAFEHVGFLVSIENRLSDISACADVVFPAALLEEQSGTFYNWEHRPRPVARVNKALRSPMTDIRILVALADAMGSDLGVRTTAQAAAELAELSGWDGSRAEAPAFAAADDAITPDGFRLATWRELIDDSRRNDGADDLLATAKPPVARLSAVTAAQAGVAEGGTVAVGTARGELTYDAVIDDTVVEGVVWIPSRASGRNVAETLGARAGDPVTAKEGARP